MGKIRRGNYVFLSWIGDHGHHVHVYSKEKMVLKWDLDECCVMEGKASRKILNIIDELVKEDRL